MKIDNLTVTLKLSDEFKNKLDELMDHFSDCEYCRYLDTFKELTDLEVLAKLSKDYADEEDDEIWYLAFSFRLIENEIDLLDAEAVLDLAIQFEDEFYVEEIVDFADHVVMIFQDLD